VPSSENSTVSTAPVVPGADSLLRAVRRIFELGKMLV
jgi:hypothetical protein